MPLIQKLKTNKYKILIILIILFFTVCYTGSKYRVFRPPYAYLINQIAWLFGNQEASYNFDTVITGKLYRSGRPDNRLVAYAKNKYGIKNIIGLAGEKDVHIFARSVGITVHIFDWSTKRLPPQEEFEAVLTIMQNDSPVLIHCEGGTDRTGYAVAAYRVLQQNWPPEKAVKEMEKYWHKPEEKPLMHRQLKDLFNMGRYIFIMGNNTN